METIWKYIYPLLFPVIIFSCNGGGEEPDCLEVESQLQNCQERYFLLENRYIALEDTLLWCSYKVDSLEKLPPVIIHDTIYSTIIDTILKFVPVYITDTVVLRDTIIKSEVIYQLDTVCVPTARCDTVMVTKLLLFNGDTNWWIMPYVRCPLEDYQIKTDILLHGYSTGMHTSGGGYRFGCLRVTVNGTDSLIAFGKHMCLDLNLEYGQYRTRVLLPQDSIRTITYTFYNDNVGSWEGEPEDINVYIYGLTVDTMDVFSPFIIDVDGEPGWRNVSQYLQLNKNGSFTVHLK